MFVLALANLKKRISRYGALGRMLAVLAVGLGLAAGTARAQTVQDALRFTQRAPAASDARSLGLAGTGRAGLADASALFYNPAGLAWMEASAAGGALAIIGTESEGRFRGPTQASVTDYGGHLAMSYKFPTRRGSLVFGGAYNQANTFGRELAFRGMNSESSITQFLLPFDDEYRIDGDFIEWTGSVLPQIAYEAGAIEFFPATETLPAVFEPAVLEGTEVEQVGTVTEEGRLSEISFGAGVEAAPNVMLGASANITYGRYQYRNELSELDNGQNDDYVVIRGGTRYEGLDEVRFEERFESELAGINLRGGLSAEAVPGVRLGVTLESPTLLVVTESFVEAEVTTFFDDGSSLSYGGQPDDPGVGESEYRVMTPWRLGGGAQVNLLAVTDGVADLTIAADAEFVDWSMLELDADYTDFADENQTAEDEFGAVLNTSVSAEYRFAGAALRAGFAHRPDPLEDGTGTETTEEDDLETDRIFYSLGAGYRFAERLHLDVGWMQEQFEDAFFPYPGDAAPRVEEDVSRSRFVVGVTYRF